MKKIFTLFSLILFTSFLFACDIGTSKDETINDGQLALQVNQVSVLTAPLFNEPPSGYEWVKFDVTLQNIGQVNQNINTILMFFIRSSSSTYDVDIFFDNALDLDGTLTPGQRKTASLVFALPKEEETFTLVFIPDIISERELTMTITRDNFE